jgi:hypothetical protein
MMHIDFANEIWNCWVLYTAPQNDIKVLISYLIMPSSIIFTEESTKLQVFQIDAYIKTILNNLVKT